MSPFVSPAKLLSARAGTEIPYVFPRDCDYEIFKIRRSRYFILALNHLKLKYKDGDWGSKQNNDSKLRKMLSNSNHESYIMIHLKAILAHAVFSAFVFHLGIPWIFEKSINRS